MKTLNQFLAQHLPEHKLPQELASVLESVAAACLDINAKVRLGALSGVLGMAGTGNIQGEDQKKLDVIANNIMIDVLKPMPTSQALPAKKRHLCRHTRKRRLFGIV